MHIRRVIINRCFNKNKNKKNKKRRERRKKKFVHTFVCKKNSIFYILSPHYKAKRNQRRKEKWEIDIITFVYSRLTNNKLL